MPSEYLQNTWSEIPPGIGKLLKQLRDSENSLSERTWRETALEDYKFYAGDQDYDYVIQKLESQSRPTSVFNEVKPKIDMLIGLAAQGKHDTTLVPVSREDEPLSELMSGVLKHYRNKLSLTRKELDCFEHTVKSGRSLLHFHVDTSNPFKPEIKAQRVRGYNYFGDPNRKEYDLSDSRYLFIENWLPEEELKVHFPSIDIFHLQQFGARYADLPQFFNEANDLYRIIEAWYYKYESVIYFINPMTQKVEDASPGDFKKILSAFAEGIPSPTGETLRFNPDQIQQAKGVKKVPYYTIFSGMQIIEEGKSQLNWPSFPCVEFGAYRNEDTNAWFSAVTMMKDSQRCINTMRRQLDHLLQTLPKGILVHEAGAILNIEEYEEHSSEPNFHLELSKGSIDRYRFETQPQISPIYGELNLIYRQAMKDASGIQDPLMGIQKTGREAGVTERMRQETGIAVLYLLFSNFQSSRHQATKILMSLIQQYVTLPEVIRIEGESGASLIEINTQTNRQVQGFNDISAMQFDLEVEDTAETATMRMTTAQILTDVNHNNPGSIPPDIILEYSDVPFSIKQRVRQAYEATQQIQQEQQLAESERVKAETEIKKAELKLKKEEIELKKAELALKQEELKSKEKIEMAKIKVAKENPQPSSPPSTGKRK